MSKLLAKIFSDKCFKNIGQGLAQNLQLICKNLIKIIIISNIYYNFNKMMNIPKISKNKNNKLKLYSTTYSNQEVAKQKLIQYSQNDYLTKQQQDNLQDFLNMNGETRPGTQDNQISARIRAHRQLQRHRQKQIQRSKTKYVFPSDFYKLNHSTQLKRQCAYLSNISRDNFLQMKTQFDKTKPKLIIQKTVKQPLSLSKYLVTGSKSCQPKRQNRSLSTPRSEYIIRQRRNQKKLKRIQQKREVQQVRAKNSLIHKIIAERQAQKYLNMKSVLLKYKYKSNLCNKQRQQKNCSHISIKK